MALTDVAIRNAKPRTKLYTLGDSLGLFLIIPPTGSNLWRVKYRILGKEKALAIGSAPPSAWLTHGVVMMRPESCFGGQGSVP